MSEFFVVKGELAAWALGLQEDDTLSAEELKDLAVAVAPLPRLKRRKRRAGHASYRYTILRRRELVAH